MKSAPLVDTLARVAVPPGFAARPVPLLAAIIVLAEARVFGAKGTTDPRVVQPFYGLIPRRSDWRDLQNLFIQFFIIEWAPHCLYLRSNAAGGDAHQNRAGNDATAK